MKTELSPLEALEKIKSITILEDYEDKGLKRVVFAEEVYKEPIQIIETALKDYELLKERTKLDSFECLLRLEEILPRGKELLIPVAKELKRKQDLEQMLHKMNVKYGYKEYLKISKAFEIIKEKRVDAQLFKDSENLSLYNWCVHTKDRALTQEEYDLLKKIL